MSCRRPAPDPGGRLSAALVYLIWSLRYGAVAGKSVGRQGLEWQLLAASDGKL